MVRIQTNPSVGFKQVPNEYMNGRCLCGGEPSPTAPRSPSTLHALLPKAPTVARTHSLGFPETVHHSEDNEGKKASSNHASYQDNLKDILGEKTRAGRSKLSTSIS